MTALAAPLFLAACAVPDGGLFRGERYRDVHLYGVYADKFFRGELPYRDLFVEYPPGAFAVFLPPAALPAGDYNFAFKSLMALCGLGALFAVALTLLSLGVRGRRLYGAAGLFALSPLVVGPISLNTYDLWPAALTAGALAALLRRRDLLAFGLLGLAVTREALPARDRAAGADLRVGRRGTAPRARICSPCWPASCCSSSCPSPQSRRAGSGTAFTRRRPVGFRSRASAARSCSPRTGSASTTRPSCEGATGAVSRDLAGSLPDALAKALSALQLVAVALVWLVFARRPPSAERLVLAAAAAVTAFLVFNRFISPQYLVWLIPLVLVVPGRGRLAAVGLLGCSLVLGQLWFFHYHDVWALDRIVWLVVARDAALACPLRPPRRSPEHEHAILGEHEPPLGVAPQSERARSPSRAGPSGRRSPAASRRRRSSPRPATCGKLRKRRRAERCDPSEFVALTTASAGIRPRARSAMRSWPRRAAA